MASKSDDQVKLLWPVQLDKVTAKPVDCPVISYGTFFPQLPEHWLASKKNCGDRQSPVKGEAVSKTNCEDRQSPVKGEAVKKDLDLSGQSFGSGGFSYPREGHFKRLVSRGSESGFESDYTRSAAHSRRESLITSPFFTPSHTPLRASPVREGEISWVDLLFNEMDKTISKAEEDLNGLTSSLEDEGFSEEDLNLTATIVSINATESDYNMIEIDDRYVNDQESVKNYRSAFGFLCRIKRIFDEECARLDSLVGMGASEEQVVKDHIASKTEEFRDRIQCDLNKTDQAMQKIRKENEMIIDGVRHRGNYPENPVVKEVKNTRISFLSWLHAVLLGSVIALLCFLCLWNLESDQWVIILRLVRSPLMVVLLLYLYVVNMKVWAKFDINYVAVFNHHPDSTPTPAKILQMASVLTMTISILVIVIVVVSPFTGTLPIKVITLVMWMILLGFLLNPFNCYQRKMRYKFVSVMVHILLAPFIYVFFTDFYLADQFNSTVAILLDMHYSMCYIFTDSWSTQAPADTKLCTSSGNGIRPIISFLPAMWRMFQCLRCYYDTLSVRHLVNAGKYFTTFPVIVFATMYSIRVKGDIFETAVNATTSWLVISWAVSALIHSGYTFLWDVSCDWGLWDIMKCKAFCRQLLYKKKGLYIVAIFFDLVLRFTWTLKLTLAIVWQVDSDLIYTGNVRSFFN